MRILKKAAAFASVTMFCVACQGSVCGEGAAGAGAGAGEENAPNKIYFHFDMPKPGHVELDAENKALVAKQVGFLTGKSITIESHCDERGTIPYNQALGERRAEAVKRELVNNGLNAASIATVSMGKTNVPFPAGSTPNKSEEERHALNRVAVIKTDGAAVAAEGTTVTTGSGYNCGGCPGK